MLRTLYCFVICPLFIFTISKRAVACRLKRPKLQLFLVCSQIDKGIISFLFSGGAFQIFIQIAPLVENNYDKMNHIQVQYYICMYKFQQTRQYIHLLPSRVYNGRVDMFKVNDKLQIYIVVCSATHVIMGTHPRFKLTRRRSKATQQRKETIITHNILDFCQTKTH